MQKESLPDGTLIFVYNADSGWQHAVLDSLHKYLRPETYSCNLCRITHGAIGPKQAWKDFLKACGRPVRFLHRDEYDSFARSRGIGTVPLPAILEVRKGTPEVLLGAEALNGVSDLELLLQKLEGLLKDLEG